MQLLETNTGSSGLYWTVEEYTVSSPIPPQTRTALSRNLGNPVSGVNPSSYVRVVGNGSTLFAQSD